MRRNSRNWSISCGVKAGHYHLYKGANCQDAAAITATDLVVGVGCDGCGEGEHSELGAIATVNFALREILRLRSSGYDLKTVVEQLFPAIVRFIDMNIFFTCPVEFPEGVADFIKHHWLSTVMGVIMLDDMEWVHHCHGEPVNVHLQHDGVRGIVFWCGDGIYSTKTSGDTLAVDVPIDQQNVPTYIAYNCVRNPARVGVEPHNIPKSFNTRLIRFDEDITSVMVASDGFEHHNPNKLQATREKEPDLPSGLCGQQWNKKGQFGLKKWMNSRSDRGYFDDDCFIITVERRCNE